MPLYRLAPRTDSLWWCIEGRDPWQPHHDRAFGFIVRADDEEQARWLAHEAGGMENAALQGVDPWLNPAYTTCAPLPAEGASEVLLVNFRHGQR